jgi:hypothetical protein
MVERHLRSVLDTKQEKIYTNPKINSRIQHHMSARENDQQNVRPRARKEEP